MSSETDNRTLPSLSAPYDLVTRLRAQYEYQQALYPPGDLLYAEAAAEIERLRASLVRVDNILRGE